MNGMTYAYMQLETDTTYYFMVSTAFSSFYIAADLNMDRMVFSSVEVQL